MKILKEDALPRDEGAPSTGPERGKEKTQVAENPEVSTLVVPPGSFAAEQFRKLKTQIFHWSSPSPRTLLVTSAVPDEGKSVVAFNLALAISQEIHKKAILVDADLRNPSLHLQEHPGFRGLSNYLSEQIPLLDIMIPFGEDNLWIIPAGPVSKKSSELIGTRKMKEFLKSLGEFREETYVVIDSPPILSAADPILLSKMVDGVILVVMADRTPRESVQRAIQLIDREKIIGVVMNQVAVKPSKYYYGYPRE